MPLYAIRHSALTLALTLLVACSNIEVSSGHLRNNVPRFTTFTTETPMAMTRCINERWVNSGRPALIQQTTDTGFSLSMTQKLDTHEKQPMIYVAIDRSREGASVSFYSNRIDDITDRSMISNIQSCH